MTNEDQVLNEAEQILRDAFMTQQDNSNASLEMAIKVAEEKAYKDNPLHEDACVYDFYLFQNEFQGTPDQMAEFKRKVADEKGKEIPSIMAAIGEEPNACVSCSLILASQEGNPANVKDVLFNAQFPLSLHTYPGFQDAEICGMMMRTLANATPENSGEVVEAIVTSVVLNDRMGNIARRTDTGEVMYCDFHPLASWKNSDPDEIKQCADIIIDKYGKIPAALYSAIHLPLAIKRNDPEMWEAQTQDFLADKAKETEQE